MAQQTINAEKLISKAAMEATKVIASAAAEALKMNKLQNDTNKDDHDILIELKTRMEDLKVDIKELKDGTASKIDNHETRLTALEVSKTRQNVLTSIGIGILTILVSLMTYHIFN
jgi:hypothetical protein